MSRRSSQILSLLALFMLMGCAIPQGAIVYHTKELIGHGIVDQSKHLNGLYIIGTGDPQRILKRGGASSHYHAYAHQHQGEISEPTPIIQPYGGLYKASSAGHSHEYETIFEEPTMSDPAQNDPPHMNVGASMIKGLIWWVPRGTIVGYFGAKIPKGWTVCDGTNNTPDLRGRYLRISVPEEYGKIGGSSQHSHGIKHVHRYVIKEADPQIKTNYQFYKQGNGYRLAEVAHGHLVKKEKQITTITSATTVSLPSAKVIFIQASTSHWSLPWNTVIPTTRDPKFQFRWKLLHGATSAAKQYGIWSGRFLLGSENLEIPILEDSRMTHKHRIDHSHSMEIQQSASEAINAPSGISFHLAESDHTHPFLIQYKGESRLSYHLPPYVELFYIVKFKEMREK